MDLNYNLENQNVLVGLLQNLSINPEWDLEYVISYTRMRSRSLCSAFDIITPHKREGSHPNTIFYGGCKEVFCLLENRKDLTNSSLSSLKSLVPIYSTITTFSYNTAAERERKSQIDYSNDVALIGVNLIELAVGWWMYMKMPGLEGHGIHHYLAGCVMPEFELLHNQMALFNTLYEHIVKDVGYSALLLGEKLQFNTLKIRDDLIAMESYWVTKLKGSTWNSNKLLMNYLFNRVCPDLPELFNSAPFDLGYNANAVWMFELTAVKYYQIYYRLINDLSYTPDMTSGQLKQLVPLVKGRWANIEDSYVRNHALDMLNLLSDLNR